jgi:hypothetical protein
MLQIISPRSYSQRKCTLIFGGTEEQSMSVQFHSLTLNVAFDAEKVG